MREENKKLVKFFKGYILVMLDRHIEGQSKKDIEQDIFACAGFPYGSVANSRVTVEDLQNLIAWAFVYGDERNVTLDYPSDELDKQINLNFK